MISWVSKAIRIGLHILMRKKMSRSLHYKETFVCFLKEIQQEQPYIILENIDVGEEYGMETSFWRVTESR